MARYEYWWHDGQHGFVDADSYELNKEKTAYEFYDYLRRSLLTKEKVKQKVCEMPVWFVDKIQLVTEKVKR